MKQRLDDHLELAPLVMMVVVVLLLRWMLLLAVAIARPQ
jgi:hypothetical protein